MARIVARTPCLGDRGTLSAMLLANGRFDEALTEIAGSGAESDAEPKNDRDRADSRTAGRYDDAQLAVAQLPKGASGLWTGTASRTAGAGAKRTLRSSACGRRREIGSGLSGRRLCISRMLKRLSRRSGKP